MGIIAGIAIPTTIAVINRQKKNAAAKSAEAVVSAMKNVLLEAQADPLYNGVDSLSGVATLGTSGITSFKINGSDSAYELEVDNAKGSGTITVVLAISGGFTYESTAVINSYSITVNSDGSCTASSSSSSSQGGGEQGGEDDTH